MSDAVSGEDNVGNVEKEQVGTITKGHYGNVTSERCAARSTGLEAAISGAGGYSLGYEAMAS